MIKLIRGGCPLFFFLFFWPRPAVAARSNSRRVKILPLNWRKLCSSIWERQKHMECVSIARGIHVALTVATWELEFQCTTYRARRSLSLWSCSTQQAYYLYLLFRSEWDKVSSSSPSPGAEPRSSRFSFDGELFYWVFTKRESLRSAVLGIGKLPDYVHGV